MEMVLLDLDKRENENWYKNKIKDKDVIFVL